MEETVAAPNKSMEPTGASGSGQFEVVGWWPLAPAAHAQRSIFMRASLLLAILCTLSAASGCVTKCPFRAEAHSKLEALAANQSNVEFLQSVTNLARSVQERLSPIADEGQRFSLGCTGTAPHARFILATKAGRWYSIAVEHGGFAYGWSTEQFLVDENGRIIEPEH
jgi:hypothetical protein